MKAKWLKKQIAIFCVAFIVRLIYLTVIVGLNKAPIHDGPEYDLIALNLLKHHQFAIYAGCPTSFRPPLYPVFLSTVYFLFGHSYVTVRVIQAVLSALSCLILFLIGRKLWSERAAILSSWIMVFYPGLIYFTGRFLTETLFIFLYLLSIYILVKASDYKQIFLGSCIMGLSILTRSNGILFVPFVVIWYAFSKRKKEFLKNSAVFMLGISCSILPWTLRNYVVHGRFVMLTTNGGVTFCLGNNRTSKGGYLEGSWGQALGFKPDFVYLPSRIPMWRGLSEIESDRKFYKIAFQWIKNNPKRFLALIPQKFLRMWSPFTTSTVDIARKYRLVYALFFTIVLGCGIWGFLISLRRWREFVLIYAVFVTFTICGLIFYGSTRLRSPADAFLILFMGIALENVYSKIFEKRAES